MIKLTNQIIVVEVPNDATDVKLEMGYGESIVLTWKSESSGYDLTIINRYWVSMVGVTPLSEEQAVLIVEWVEEEQYYRDYRKDGWQGDIPAIQSFATLLESKGLDVNKKYVIIKITDYEQRHSNPH